MSKESSQLSPPFVLNKDEITQFQRDGVLVVNKILDSNQIEQAIQGLQETLLEKGIDVHNLRETGHNLTLFSSTNGSGGVLDIYYPSWKLDICTNERLFDITRQLWYTCYCHEGETLQALPQDEIYKYHPYGPFNCNEGYCYLDRIGFRIPTHLAVEIGNDMKNRHNKTTSHKQNKIKQNKVAIQRSLTPHFDCCPETFYDTTNKLKWRPIQCFVSLSDTLEPNQGGLEAAPGFHNEFYHWAMAITNTSDSSSGSRSSAPCIGEYIHVRPKEDEAILKRIQHVPNIKAGSAVFWDNRIPHANSYFHDGPLPRIVIYCSFLPKIEINQKYIQAQFQDYRLGNIPGSSLDSHNKNGDRWIIHQNKERKEMDKQHASSEDGPNAEEMKKLHVSRNKIGKDDTDVKNKDSCILHDPTKNEHTWTPLGRKLMGIDPW